MNNSFLPVVKKVSISDNTLPLADTITFSVAEECARLINYVQACRTANKTFDYTSSPERALLLFDINDLSDGDIPEDVKPESYKINIASDGITIQATSEQGLFYGFQTLCQLLEQSSNDRVKLGELVDWPDFKTRAMHITFGNGNMPTFERFKTLIPEFASFKYNTLIFEYDDRFPWSRHPVIPHKEAFSKEQLTDLIQLAEAHFLEVVPLVDSLGHAKQYLKHDAYSHLKELPDKIAELCPSNPETLIFIKELWEEVLELHPNARYAHITGDEVFRQGGYCPECQTYADEGKLAELFLNYYTDLSQWILSKGKIPVIWGDMLIKYPDCIERFPREVVINDWCYIGNDRDYLDCCHDIYDPAGNCDEERKQMFEPYWHDGKHNGYKQYPYFQFFKDQGFTTMAATASSKYEEFIPSPSARFVNNKRFAIAAKNAAGDGFVNTFWSTYNSIESAWFGILAGANFSWTAREEELEPFAERVCTTFLHLPKADAEKLLSFTEEKVINMPVSDDDSLAANYCRLLNLGSRLNVFDRQLIDLSIKQQRVLNGNSLLRKIDLTAAANSTVADSMPNFAPTFELSEGRFPLKDDQELMPEHGSERVICLKNGEAGTVQIESCFDQLGFYTMCHAVAKQQPVAKMTVTFSDGTEDHFNFTGGDNVGDWWGAPKLDLNAQLVWTGKTFDDNTICAYKAIWRNPYSHKEISEITLTHSEGNSRMVIFAISGETRRVGMTEASFSELIKSDADRLDEDLHELKKGIDHVYRDIMVESDRASAMDIIFSARKRSLQHCWGRC